MAKEPSAAALARWRMHSLLLGAQRAKSVAEVARWFGAMQAQDVASGKWSFGVRLPTCSEQDIDAAVDRGEVLRTWPMRGTLHFVPAEDAGWMLEVAGIKALAKATSRQRQLGLDAAAVNRAADVLGKALAGGKRFTRAQAVEHLRSQGLSTEGQLAYHLLWSASQMGVTCLGPNLGKEQSFVLLSEWVPRPRHLAGDEAFATLALRYFRSHGPASQQDFMGWTGLSAAEAKQGMAAVASELASCIWQGKTLWMQKSLPDEAASAGRARLVHTLPGFDEYLLGIKDRTLAVPTAHQHRIIPGNNGMFMPTMVVDGVTVGVWKRTLKKAEVLIEPAPFETVPAPLRAAFDEAFAAYARYLGLRAQVRWPSGGC